MKTFKKRNFAFFVLISLSIFVCLCSLQGEDIKEVILKPVYQFGGLDVDAQNLLNRPSDFIITGKNEIIVCDADENNVVFFNQEGSVTKKIGRSGQGPGDFSRPGKVAILDDNLLVHDSGNYRIQIISMSGESIKIHPSFTLTELGAKMWFSGDGSYYFSTRGYNSDSLIIHRSLEGEELGRFGKIYGEATNVYKFENDLIKKGKVPDSYKNKVFPVVDSDGFVYCIHSALPLVKKFNKEGNLVWEKSLDLPEFKKIKSKWITLNKEAPPKLTYGLYYWRDIEFNNQGELLLLVYFSDQMIIYRLDRKGNVIVRYKGVKDKISMIAVYDKELWAFGGDTHKFYKFIL